MTEAPEAAAARPSGAWRLVPYAAPALVLLAVVVPFLRFHEYSLLLPESLMLMGGAVLIGAAVGALSRLRPRTLGPMLMALTLCVYIFYRQEVTDLFIVAANAIADVTGHPAVVLALLGVALFLSVCLVAVLLRRHLDLIVTAVFGTIVLSTVALPVETGGAPVETGALPETLNDLPPVIHIVLDEHIGIAGLPVSIESDAALAAIKDTYEDFALYSHAYSRFAETKYSLTSLMNGDLGADVGTLVDGDRYTSAPKENDWFDTLRENGYAIRAYQSAWFDMCEGPHAADSCYTYSFFSPNAIQRAPLTTTQRLRALARQLLVGRGSLQLEPLVSREALARFRADIAETPHGVAYVVHLLMPHYGYLYSHDCTLLDPSEWERQAFGEDQIYTPRERAALYRRYLEQLVCASREMQALFAELKTLGLYDEATIVVHGDHGSRIGRQPYISEMPRSLDDRDKLDHFATLLAVKAPGIAAGMRDEPAALQRVFAEAFLGGARPGGPESSRPEPGEVFLRNGDEDRFNALQLTFPDGPPSVALETAPQKPGTAARAALLEELRR
jgi:hypothetical protein